MCLGIPGCIDDIDETGPLTMGTVRFGAARRAVCLAWVPEAAVGDYVIVHAGFALSVVDEVEARRTLELLASNPLEPSRPSEPEP